MRRMIGALALGAAMSLSVAGAAEEAATTTETRYVLPQPTIMLLSAPSADAPAAGRVAPGTALSVTARQAGFVQVQSADGTQGWLAESQLTDTPPPGQRVSELEQEVERLRTALAEAQTTLRNTQTQLRQARQAAASARETGADQSAALETENQTLQESLAAAQAEISRLQERITEMETARQMAEGAARLLAQRQPPAGAMQSADIPIARMGAGIVAALVFGLLCLWGGAVRERRRLRRRYHGLEL